MAVTIPVLKQQAVRSCAYRQTGQARITLTDSGFRVLAYAALDFGTIRAWRWIPRAINATQAQHRAVIYSVFEYSPLGVL